MPVQGSFSFTPWVQRANVSTMICRGAVPEPTTSAMNSPTLAGSRNASRRGCHLMPVSCVTGTLL